MAKLTNVSCEYTGGGVYVYTALLNDDVWFMTDFQTYDSYGCYDAPLDVVEADILPDGYINYDGHWKDPSAPLPQWYEIVRSIRSAGMDFTADEVAIRLPADQCCRVGEKELPPVDKHSQRLETLALIVEVFEDFLERRGIDIPNPDRDEDPCASLIYGMDYAELSDNLEELLVSLGMMEKEGE